MFDNYVFIDGSGRNVENGFEVQTLITYYRGIPLSMVHNVVLEIDGSTVPREELVISPDGDNWFTLDEATTVTDYRWEYSTPLSVRWLTPGGLPSGDHEVTVRLRIRTAYIPRPFGGDRTRTVSV
ncbi:C-glycoside deglycosidase beta subunit domain-containing protein [Virgisporangium aurantiacum]|uniref:C-deglycosylation enzyme beta subunit n=1 Tax=Virgisporangium aurantiacum TaxID=175570 RepID=A0A8J3ZDZ2_9ACTN|nr:DUF6379 domain-containing protein [Virgisporangium aurantiacum]GIJ62161.1 hypothetical protein Vau01_096770 [Virgisporangium aurantiacum]